MTRVASITAVLLLLPGLASAQLPERVDPLVYGDDDAQVRLSLIAQTQLTLDYQGDNRTTELTPRLRRLRPIVRARFFEGRLSSTLHVEANPESAELIDAWVELVLLDALRIRGGQLKIPFTDYWQRALTVMAVDWPLSSRWFGGERQLGAMAHGADPGTGVRYAFGVFAGQGRRKAFARELSRLYGDPMPNASSFTDFRAPEMHAEFVGRIAHHSANVNARTGMDTSGEPELRHAVALSFAWDTEPERGRDFAFRLAPEALFKLAGFSLGMVAYLGVVETWDGTQSGHALGAVGGLVELGWHAHRHLELNARYARVGITDALREDADATLTGQHELTVAVQVPILGRSLIVQSDIGWLRAERTNGDRDDLRVRLQLQAAF